MGLSSRKKTGLGAGEVLDETKRPAAPDGGFRRSRRPDRYRPDDALLILEKDPDLKSERGKAIRTLLYLFERDAVVKTALSG